MPSNGFLRSVVAIFARSALFFLLLLSSQAKPVAEAQTVRQVAGVTQVRQVPHVTESWSDTIGRSAQSTVPIPWQIGHFPGFRAAKAQANTRRQSRSTAGRIEAEQQLNPASTSQGVVFDGPNEADTRIVPPDPVIAAGPASVVVVVNSLMAIYDKSGNLQGSFQNLSNFFSSLNVSGEIFDPRVIYDQTDQRFILTATEVDFTNLSNGHVLVAVSATSDPTGAWNKWALNFMGANPGGTASTFPDFPTLGLGSSAVYIGTNQFELTQSCLQTDTENCRFSDAWITVVGLPGLLNPSQNPALTITTFKDVLTADGQLAFSIQPALTYGSSTDEFLVAADFNANPSSTLNLYAVSTSGTPTLSSANLTVPAFGLPPDAVQEGSSNLIATDDFRPLNAVWANGSLWFAQNVQNSGGNGGVAAEWYELQLSSLASASLAQSGSVTGTGEAYYPAISVEADGGTGLAFTTSSSASYPSAAFTEREASDAPGTMRSFLVYKAGAGPYDDTGFDNRWGDYSGISQDPSGNGFWTIAEYASTPNPQFGTSIAQMSGAPTLSVSPTSLNFGSVVSGSTAKPQTVTLTNIGSSSITLGHAVLVGANAAEFTISSDACSGVSLGANQSCTVSVTFTPPNPNPYSALLTIPNGASSINIGLLGQGISETGTPSVTLSTTALVFPATPTGSASTPQTVTLTNTGTGVAAITGIALYGPFTETNNCGTSLAGGGSCQFSITFRPFAPGSLYGSLSFGVGNPSAPTNGVALSGVGTPVPRIVFCPASINFAAQALNTASNPQPVIVTNNGSSQLTITGISASGGFSETNNCVGSLAPFASCTIDITFTPVTAGAQTGAITVSDDASGSPQAISLSGTGGTGSALLLSDPRAATPLHSASAVAQLTNWRESPWRDTIAPRVSAGSPPRSASSSLREGSVLAGKLRFELNEGQFDPVIQFAAHVDQYNLALLKTGAILTVRSQEPEESKVTAATAQYVDGESAGKALSAPERGDDVFVRMQLVGANPDPRGAGADELPGKANYFIGRNRIRWRTNVPTYAKINFRQVYPGIDLAYYGNHKRLEYDFVVSPGADPKRIRMAFSGVTSLRVDRKSGDLIVGTRGGPIRFQKPVVYQVQALSRWHGRSKEARRIYRQGRFVLVGARQVSFRLGCYDRKAPLVIDPVLVFSTYLAGTGGDVANAIAVDSSGNAYVTGWTLSLDFPITSNAFQKTCGRDGQLCNPYVSHTSAFVSEISSDGSTLVYSTYLGGENADQGNAIAVDSSGNAYVTGSTASPDFPITSGAFETVCAQPSQGSCGSAFVTKLDPSGSGLVYSTYLGGDPAPGGSDKGNAIAVDSQDDVFVGGAANSTDFPTTPGAFQTQVSPAPEPLYTHGFMTELNPSGSALVYSTFLGGSGGEGVHGIAIDSSGDVYVAGETDSLDFPVTANSIEPNPQGNTIGNNLDNGFIAKFDPAGNVLYGTYFSGPVQGVVADSNGSAYVTGGIPGGSLPTTNGSFQTTSTAGSDADSAFLTKFHPAGCALLYSTYLGGNQGKGIALDASGDAYVAGSGRSDILELPLANPLEPGSLGNAFITEINPAGSSLLFSTTIGGSNVADSANGIALDSQGDIYVAGEAASNDFPIANALEPDCTGCSRIPSGAFVMKISPAPSTGVSLTRPELTFAAPSNGSGFYASSGSIGLTNHQSVPLNIASVSVNGTAFSLSPPTTATCTSVLAPGTGCIVDVQFTPTSSGAYTGTLTINDSGPGSPRTVALRGAAGPPFTLTASPQFSGNPVAGTDSLNYSISVGALAGYSGVAGEITLSCGTAVTKCSFSPASLSAGSQSTLVLSGLGGINLEGTDSYSITVNASYAGQTLSLPLTIKFADFLPSITPTSATVSPGQAATYSVSISPINGMTGNISLSCAGAPTLATCAVSPPSVSLDGTKPAIATVTVTTTAGSSLAPTARRAPPPSGWPGVLLLVAFAVAVGLCARRRLRTAPLALGIILLLIFAWASCGGGGGSGGGGGGSPGTPAGTYSLTVTGTYAGSTNLKQSVTVTLAVH